MHTARINGWSVTGGGPSSAEAGTGATATATAFPIVATGPPTIPTGADGPAFRHRTAFPSLPESAFSVRNDGVRSCLSANASRQDLTPVPRGDRSRPRSGSRLPAFRIAAAVHARDNDYCLGKLSVKDAVGKTLQQRPARAAMNNRVALRILGNLG